MDHQVQIKQEFPFAGNSRPTEEEDGRGNMSKLEECTRHTEAQRLRCRNLLKKLKAIQLDELEEYGEEQMESAVVTIAKTKGIHFPEVNVPTFLQRTPVPNDFYAEEADVNRLEAPNIHDTAFFEKKRAMEHVRDVTIMMKTDLKETMLSAATFVNETYETDPDSDYEDEFEAKVSVRGHRDKEDFQGYLPVEENPLTKWARQRHEILTRWKFLQDGLRNINYRLTQQDEFLRHLRENKPEFKFDENAVNQPRKHPVLSDNAKASLKNASIEVFHEADDPSLNRTQPATQESSVFIGYGQKPNGANNPEGGTVYPPINCARPEILPDGRLADPSLYMNGKLKRRFGGGLESLKLTILDNPDPVTSTARRCLPVKPFRARKIFQLGGVHNIIGKPVKPLTALCYCYGRTELCSICSGRSDKMKPIKNATTTRKEASALLDHTYHRALCTSDQKPLRKLIESSLKTEEWNKALSVKQQLMPQNDSSSEDESNMSEVEVMKPIFLHTKPVRLVDTIAPPSPVKKARQARARPTKKKVKETKAKKSRGRRKRRSGQTDDEEDDEEAEAQWTPVKRTKSYPDPIKRRRIDEKYDIDHIVIPYSIAAATRVEKIEYKEIMIPSWRDNPIKPLQRPSPKSTTTRVTRRRFKSAGTEEEGGEDISLETIVARHYRSELEEKQRFLKALTMTSNRRARRSESKAENSEGVAPVSVSPTPEISEIVPPQPVVDEVALPVSSNQISLADASLAVTALKISNANGARRRTVSTCKVDEEEIQEDAGYTPFEPRKFPLSASDYAAMVKEMEEAYKESERMGVRSFEGPTITTKIRDDEGSDAEDKLDDPDWNDNPPTEQPNPPRGTKLNRRSKRGSLVSGSKDA